METQQVTSPSWGVALRVVRAVRGYEQGETARLSRLTPSHLSLVEAGRRNPSTSALDRLCATLGVDLSALAKIAENPEKALGIEAGP